ncbi:hypothetical protein [Teredinibacter sp. KSP-S5-2]|uniref:hypothetical protein n=1 Tax=Teredinibacter sp. KSP-S5-2 TaxID=3034506 RepID=UPI002934EF9D|nr:hypothetical protein [Teredinibacter sp. KSP-S5-2]WNO10529.1 hypothetical protein P5V12_05020 [Teredinibacter sp. KSP-S5-2]
MSHRTILAYQVTNQIIQFIICDNIDHYTPVELLAILQEHYPNTLTIESLMTNGHIFAVDKSGVTIRYYKDLGRTWAESRSLFCDDKAHLQDSAHTFGIEHIFWYSQQWHYTHVENLLCKEQAE